MSYVVKTAQQHFDPPNAGMKALFADWIKSASTLIEGLEDADSVNRRALVSLPRLKGTSDLAECRVIVNGVQKIGKQMLLSKTLGDHATSLKTQLDAVAEAITGLAATGLSESPPGDSESQATQEWWSQLGKLFAAIGFIEKIALELTPTMMRLTDCGTIVGQIMESGVDPKDLLLLLHDGEIVAMAAIGSGASSILVKDIVVSPQYIRKSGKGAGSALMEYIARDAKKTGVGVYLLALGDAARGVYRGWGFVQAGDGMSLQGEALNAFLKKYTTFAPS